MKIGIDLDGVVIDSEATFRTYEEIFAIEDLNGRKITNPDEPKYQGRYDWTKEEQDKFNNKYLLQAAEESSLMSGFLTVYQKLKELGHQLIVITARGLIREEMKENAISLLEHNGIFFDKYYWSISDKLEICNKENIDVMIDDDYKIIEQLSNAKIKTLYFRDTNLRKLQESNYVHEVNNWGDIYRYFKELEDK